MTSLVPFADAIRPLSRSEYDRLVDMGWFADERLELIDGLLVSMSPQKPPHAGAVRYLGDLLTRALGERALVQVQLPLAVSDLSEPEPDIAVVERRQYRDAHPTTALLIIEVADNSLAKDRHKARLYAAAGVPEYWIVDVHAGIISVHTDPDPAAFAYRTCTEHRAGDELHPVAFPDIGLQVTDILG